MDTQWEINTGNGIITTSKVCKSCSVEVCGRELGIDMFVIDTGGYDVILSMTWFSKYHAMIDYRNKSVSIRILHKPEFKFIGESKASSQMQQGVCATTETKEKPKQVVEEFLEVFPEDLSGLPPDRDVEFSIEVILGIA